MKIIGQGKPQKLAEMKLWSFSHRTSKKFRGILQERPVSFCTMSKARDHKKWFLNVAASFAQFVVQTWGCTNPSHSQSLADLSQTSIRKEFPATRTKFHNFIRNHSHSLAHSLATLNSQLFVWDLVAKYSLAHSRGASEYAFAFAAVSLRPRLQVQILPPTHKYLSPQFHSGGRLAQKAHSLRIIFDLDPSFLLTNEIFLLTVCLFYLRCGNRK